MNAKGGEIDHILPKNTTAEVNVRMFLGHSRPSPQSDMDVDVVISFKQLLSQRLMQEPARVLASELCKRYPAISTNERVLGGVPHIKGMRVSVPHILAHLHHLGSIDAIEKEFKQRINREQVQQALAYAHDFMEMACDPSQDDY